MSRAAFGALLAAALIAGSTVRAALPKDGDAWLEMRTRHFTVLGDASESRMREVALTLERFQAVLGSLTTGRAVNVPLKTTVFVFASEAAFEPYKPLVNGRPAAVAGYFMAARDENFIALSARWNSDPRPVVYHEYLHHFMQNNFPPQPAWFQEGLAEYYSSFEADEKRALVGRALAAHLGELRETAPWPLARLFAVGMESREYNEPELRRHFYAESWALVHMLVNGEPRRVQALFSFLKLLRDGEPEPEAFHAAFGIGEDAMLSELVAYVRSDRFLYAQVPLRADLDVPTRVAVWRMRREEVLAALASLLEAQRPQRGREVDEHLGAALAIDPCHARALELVAGRHLAEKRFDEAQRALEDASAADPFDPHVPYALGEVLLRRAFAEGAIDGAHLASVLAAVRAAYRLSLELDPFPPLVHAALGRTWLSEPGGDLREGIFELEAAVERLPGRPELLSDLATLYRRAGDSRRGAELARAADEAERLSPGDSMQRTFQRKWDEVNRLLDAHRDEEALAHLESMAAQAGPEIRAELERDAARLRATANRNADVRRYNDAIALLNAQKLPLARAAFEALEREAKTPEIARAAAEQKTRIDDFLSGTPSPPKRRPAKSSG